MEKKTDSEKFIKDHPINFGHAHPKRHNSNSVEDLPRYKWIQIDSTQGVGMNFAYRLRNEVVVATYRYHGKNFETMTNEEYKNWRTQIKSHRGQ